MASIATNDLGAWQRIASDYWHESRRPLASLLMVAPLLCLYEGAIVWLGSAAMRNGAANWLHQVLDWIGFGQYIALPALTVCALLAWHHTTRQPWRVSGGVVYGMAVESAAMAMALVAVARVQGLLSSANRGAPTNALAFAAFGGGGAGWLARLAGFSGAGIYEELLFRLLLVPLATAVIRAAGVSPRASVIGAIVLTGLLFSAAHYAGPYGDRLEWFSFVFRFLAGVFFGTVFVYRGFGIAAGTHALYDILAAAA